MKCKTMLLIVSMLLLWAISTAAETRLTIVHTNDMHSHLSGFAPELDYQPFTPGADSTLGGWARVASIIDRTRKEKTHPVLVFDAGDFTMGSLFHMLNREEAFELRLLAAMGYDTVTLGNHEFDLKPAGLAATLRAAKAKNGLPPLVLANAVFDRSLPVLADLEDAFTEAAILPYRILERGSLKIGVFGLIGRDAAEVSPFAKPLTFRDPLATAREMVDVLRNQKKVDVVICLSHGGLRDNPKHSEDEILAKRVPGIDVIVSGHTHTKLDTPILINKTIIVQAWCYGRQVGILDLTWQDGQIRMTKYTPVEVNSSWTADAKIQAMIDAFKNEVDAQFLAGKGLSYDQLVASTPWDLNNRAEESTLGNLLADAIRWTVNNTNSDKNDSESRVAIAVESNGIIRDDLLAGKTGLVSVGDLFRTFPLGIGVDDTMGYPLISFYLYGYEIKRAMEILTSVRPLKNDDYFLQISGLRFEYNPRRMIFDRVTRMEIGSEEEGYTPLDYSRQNRKLYRVAANLYNATFLKMVGQFTYSLLDIAPKDKAGRPLQNLSDARLDADPDTPGLTELKQWEGMIRYVQSFPDTSGDGLPDLPQKYSGKLGRIIEAPSCHPWDLIRQPGTTTGLALAALGVILLGIITAVFFLRLRIRARRAQD